MGELHKLPTRKSGPSSGYCMDCGFPMPWPVGEWPDACPLCQHSPVMLASLPPSVSMNVITDGEGKIIGTITTP